MRTLLVISIIVMSSCFAEQFKFGSQTLTVPEGFEVELVAGPPLVNRPINLSMDELGRLYVTDSAGMSDKAQKQLESKLHRVVRLDAANASGVFEKSVVFADKMMFPEGCLWHDGSLLVSAPPQIWKLTDTDGDGVADKREVWHDGKTLTGCANDLHGPYLGRDGWIYWCKGAFAEQTITLPDGKPFVSRAAHIFRARPDGTNIEPVLTGGMDNPVGLAFNSVGERFLSCTFFQNPAGGKRDGLIHAIYGGVYGKVHDVLNGHKMTGDVLPVLTHWGAAAPCGMICYDSGGFGPEFRDNLFTCSFNLHKVIRTVLVPDGATYRAADVDFLSSDSPDFHPTDVLEDADGSLLVADTGGWYKICCPTSQLAKPDVLGAIYRVRKKGVATLDDPRGLRIEWAKSTPAALASLLGDPRHVVAKRAISMFAKLDPTLVSQAVRTVLENSTNPDACRNAVWAMAGCADPEARGPVRIALHDSDISVVHAAIHVAGLWRDVEAVEKLHRIAGLSDNQGIIRAAAEALGRIGDKRSVTTLLFALGYLPPNAIARVFEHSLTYAIIEIGDVETVRGRLRASSNPRIVSAAMIALDQMPNGDLKPEEVAAYFDSPRPQVRETAQWIARRHADWGDALQNWIVEQLNAPKRTDAETQGLIELLSAFVKSPRIQELLSRTALNPLSDDAQIVVLKAMAGARLKVTPVLWTLTLAKIIPALKGGALEQAISTAQTFRPAKGDVELPFVLYQLTADSRDESVMLNALHAIVSMNTGFECSPTPGIFKLLMDNLVLSKPATNRNMACSVLVKMDLTASQQLALAATIRETVGPMELRQLLPAFERGANETLGMALLEALKNAKHARGIRPEIVRPVFAKYPKNVNDAAEGWFAELSPNAAVQAAHLDELLKKLPAGDVHRGHIVFHGTKATCTTCHATGYLGGTLGPDLTSIGKTRTERDLLESIVYPSASFVRSYEPFALKTKSGERFNGILKKDGREEVVIALDAKTEKRIARDEIETLEPGTVSIMPDGFETLLTAQELADLIAFLRASK